MLPPSWLLKQAVGANARRIAKLIHANPSAPGMHRLYPVRSQVPQQTARNVSRLLGNPAAPAQLVPAQQEARAIGELMQNVRTPQPRPVTPRESQWLDDDLVRRSLSGRHAGNRRLYTAQELASRPAGPDDAFRGFRGQGTPFQGRPQAGSALFVTGNVGPAVYYGLPDVASGASSSKFGPYFSKLRVSELAKTGPSGPWTPHLAMDTRKGFGNLFAKVMNATGLGKVLARGTANVPGASAARFERVFTAPPSLYPQTAESYKYLGNVGGQPSFMRVVGKG